MAKICKLTGASLSGTLCNSHTVVWLAILLISGFQIQAQTKNDVPPNLVVILCDNLGYGDIGPFGSQTNKTPGLIRMAREGRMFTHFYATAGVCTPSRASIMTGCHPFFLFLSHAMPGSTEKPFASEAFRGKSAGGDNGAPMTEDTLGTERGTNKPLYGRGYTTSEGGFRVPTIMWWPGTIPAGSVCDELATTMDFLPTFARLAGARLPEGRIIDGRDIYPLIAGKEDAKSPHQVFYYYNADQLQAVRRGPWKLFLPLTAYKIHPHFKAGERSKPLLFNLVEDISSSHNVADRYPAVISELMSLAESGRADLGDVDRPGANQRTAGRIEDPDRASDTIGQASPVLLWNTFPQDTWLTIPGPFY